MFSDDGLLLDLARGIAAVIQSGIGNVAAGSLFAMWQSIAMGGVIPWEVYAVSGFIGGITGWVLSRVSGGFDETLVMLQARII